MKKICIECGKEFEAKRVSSIYCYDAHTSVCVMCGNEFQYTCSPKHKPNTCSPKCKQLFKEANLSLRYGEGVTNVSQLSGVKDKKKAKAEESLMKSRQTCLDRYGVESVSKVKDIVDKQKASRATEECKEHTRQTYQERYGVDHIFQNPEFRSTYCDNVDHNRVKALKTLEEKYNVVGINSATQIPEIAQKAKASYTQTIMDRYDGVRPCSTDKVKQKISAGARAAESKRVANNQSKYHVDYPQQTNEVSDKISQAISDPEYQRRFKDLSLEHFGVSHPMKCQEVQDRVRDAMIAKYGYPYIMQSPEMQEKMKEQFNEKYGVDWPWFMNSSRDSKTNQEFRKMLEDASIQCSKEFNIDGSYYDISIADSKVLIEIDPTYTHNAVGNHWDDTGLPENYHINKSILAQSHGYQCIHVFDWDDAQKIINMLGTKQSIYARKCEVREIDETTCNTFLNQFHLQHTCKGQKVRYGLYHLDELVEVMTFGVPRYSKKHQWELLRLCTRSDVRVVGGASKLFNYFLNEFYPKSIISYCDRSKFSGSVYEEIGMRLDHVSAPAKVWSKGNKMITDNLLRQRGYDQLFGTDFGKGTSNEELMISSGWLPVYDCGQQIFVYSS